MKKMEAEAGVQQTEDVRRAAANAFSECATRFMLNTQWHAMIAGSRILEPTRSILQQTKGMTMPGRARNHP